MELKEVAVGYKKTVLVDGISFTVSSGEIVSLIGRNGAGKSTILKSIAGQLALLGGTVSIGEMDLAFASGKLRAQKMAVMTTGRVRTELMSCRDVIEQGRYPYTGSLGILSNEDHAIVEEIIERASCMDIADADFMELSDGQKQRVLLARALVQKPEVLILDEPTSFLDLKYKLELLGLVKKLAKEQNIAVIMSLHELDFAKTISDTVVCIMDGKIDKVGVPNDILTPNYIKRLYEIDEAQIDSSLVKLIQC